MAKTRAPLLSLEASGSLAKVLIMSRGRRQPYTKFNRKPKDPQTAKQLGRRAWWKGLANAWSLFSPAEKLTWQNAPNPNDVTLYNVYMQYNMKRIDRGEFPSIDYPWNGTGAPGDFLTPTLTAGPRHIQNAWEMTTVGSNWLLLIYLSDSPLPDPTHQHLVRAITRASLGWETYIDTPLEPGTWYYRARSLSGKGNPYLWWWTPSAVVPSS